MSKFVCNKCGGTSFFPNGSEDIDIDDSQQYVYMCCENCDEWYLFRFEMTNAVNANEQTIPLLTKEEVALNKAIEEGDLDTAWEMLFELPSWRQVKSRHVPYPDRKLGPAGWFSVQDHISGYYADLRGSTIDLSEWEHDWIQYGYDAKGNATFEGISPEASDQFKNMLWYFCKNRITSYVNDW